MSVTSKPFPLLSTVYHHPCTLGLPRFFRKSSTDFSAKATPCLVHQVTLIFPSFPCLAFHPFLEIISYYISVQKQSRSSCLQVTLLQAVNVARWNVVKKFLCFYHKKYISSILNCREAKKYQQNEWIKIRHQYHFQIIKKSLSLYKNSKLLLQISECTVRLKKLLLCLARRFKGRQDH